MKTKRIAGLFILVMGVVLTGFAIYAKQKISSAKHGAEEVSEFLPNNAWGGSAKRSLSGKLSQYDSLVYWSFAGGITLMIVGLGITLFLRRK
jgi:hypothetical protein